MKIETDTIKIREMKADDSEQVAAVITTAFSCAADRQHSDPMFRDQADTFRGWENTQSRKDFSGTLIAEHAGKVIGLVKFGADKMMPGLKIGHIGFFATDSKYQGQGAGRKLLAAVREQFLRQGAVLGRVHTDASAFIAVRAYENIGLKIYDLEMVYTIVPSQCAGVPAEGIVLEKVEPDQIECIQRIDANSFRPYEFFIHKEFPVESYNRYLKERLVSGERYNEIAGAKDDFLLAYNRKEPIGYCRVRHKKNFSAFFKKQIVDLDIKTTDDENIKPLLAVTVKKLEQGGVDVADMLVRYLDQPMFDAVQDLGFRLVHCPIWMGGKFEI